LILKGDVSKDEKKRLQTELINYWDDSLKVREVLKYGIRTVIEKPSVYDSTAVSRSILFMNSYLNSQGYYNAQIKPLPVKIVPSKGFFAKEKDQYRTTVEMEIDLQKGLSVDKISYDSIADDSLRHLALVDQSQSLLVKNEQFNNSAVSGELDRLVALYRKNGYYKFTRENIFAEVDTINPALLEVTLDPFEQARKIAEAEAARKVNPTINVIIRTKASSDTNAFKRYHIGWVYFYPETLISENPDSLINTPFSKVTSEGHFTVKQDIPIIKIAPLRRHSYMREGSLYNEQNYYRTINALSTLGPWNQIDTRILEKIDSGENILDFHFFLTPDNKYSFGNDLEVSRNSGSIISGNLLGISNVVTLRNRNVWKQAIQSSTVVRAGIELGFTDTALQTFQASVSQTFSLPRLLVPYKVKNLKRLDDYKTVINFNGSFTDRLNFFRLRSGVASFGYEWKKKNQVWLYKPLNLELYSLDTLAGLSAAFISNPFLRTAFNTGYVVSQTFTYSIGWPNKRKKNILNNYRISVEEAGAIAGRFKGIREKIYQYLKFESEFRKLVQWRKTSVAGRAFAGVGINYSNDPILGKSLPFFKQFVAGGPYSMRAWGVRQLGLGSSLLSDTSTVFRDRFGDIQLETNFEFRFPLTTIGTLKVNSALFADIGNIWNLKNDVQNPDSKLSLSNLYRDIAIAAGTGLRFDFNFFLVRIDFAYKVKDPARLNNNGWMSIKDFEWRNREFEVKDGKETSLKRNNFSFQLGIGLPF
jgi:hypothetical protein